MGVEEEEEVKIKLRFLKGVTTIKDMSDVSGGFFAMTLQNWIVKSLPTIPFAFLPCPNYDLLQRLLYLH